MATDELEAERNKRHQELVAQLENLIGLVQETYGRLVNLEKRVEALERRSKIKRAGPGPPSNGIDTLYRGNSTTLP